MPSTRNDPDRHLDGTYPRGEYSLPNREREPLTSQQKNWRARRIEEDHGHKKDKPMLEPGHEQLKNMSTKEKADMLDRVGALKEILANAGVNPPETGNPEAREEFFQPELPFDK